MPATRDFATQPLGQADTDSQPPAYNESEAPPEYEHPPDWRTTITNGEEGITLKARIYLGTTEVQLSPLELLVLRELGSVPVYVAIEKPARQGKGVRATLRWLLERHLTMRWVKVKPENIDDYGRWTGPIPT